MKIFLLLFALMPLSLYSQITITDADMPSPGSKYINTSALADLTIDLNATGENFLWDYSDQIPLYSLGDTFIDSDDLPLIFLLFFFNSSLADKSGVNVSLDQFTIEDVYTVYKKTTSQYQIDGFGGTIDGLSLPVVYSSKDVLYRFPMNFGNTDSCDASIVLDIPGLAYFSQQRHRVNSIDGWGTINTPSGSYDALRVKSTITDIDSVFLDTLSFGYSTSLKSIEYKWLAKESGIPVFQINAPDILRHPVH